MFVHYLKFKMDQRFIDLIKELQNKINSLNITHDTNWTIHYSKSLTLFEAQSRGNLNKINTIKDVNNLMDGFVENYYGIIPEIQIDGLVINIDNKGKFMICLRTKSNIISNMRLNLAYYFNYIDTNTNTYNSFSELDKNIIVKNFISVDGKQTQYSESVDIELPIISESYLKKNISIERVYLILSDILYNYYNEVFYPVSLHFETENTRAKKISLW